MCRALNQRSKGVWLLHVDESNFGRCKRRFRGKASRVSHACDDWHRRGTQEAQNITARLPACTDEKNRIPDARCTHSAMIERLWRVRDPMRPRPIDVGVAGDAPLRAAMRTCQQSGKSNVSREIPFLSRGLSSTQRRHPPALAISSNVRILKLPWKRNVAAPGRVVTLRSQPNASRQPRRCQSKAITEGDTNGIIQLQLCPSSCRSADEGLADTSFPCLRSGSRLLSREPVCLCSSGTRPRVLTTTA
jgi:hypothetical protein